jgi:hemoglobin/transferrin/lactoferrin receptor protein
MSFRGIALAVVLANCLAPLNFAQDQPAASSQNSLDEITLPEVGVTPPADVTPPDETVLPEVEVVPSAESMAPETTAIPSSSLRYPSLSDQVFGQSVGNFGQSTGVLRGQQSLFDTSAAASITTRQDLIEKQSPDMFNALQNEVGVLMQRTAAGQSSPFVRGLTGQQVLILVDGVRLNNSFFRRGPNQYFNTIDPGMVDHIEVLRGQGSVLWGSDAIGGVINVVTRGDRHCSDCLGDYAGYEFHQNINTADSSSYSRASVEGWVDRVGVFGGGSFLNVRDLDTGFGFGRQPGTNWSQYAGDVKFRYLVSDTQMLTVALQHFEQSDVPRSDRFPGYPGDLNNSNTPGGARFFDPQQRDLAYIRYEALDPLDFIDAVTFTASFHRQRETQTRGQPTTRTQETDVETTGLNLVAVRDLEELGKLSSGFDWYYDDVDSRFGGSASGPIIPDDAYYARVGTFLNWDVALTDRLSATAGVRYEYAKTSGTPIIAATPVPIDASYDDWVSQVGLVYELNSTVHLVGSISEGFRAPNLDDLMANNPNVLQMGMSVPSLGLKPEHSRNYEVGIKTNGERLRTQTFVYWLDLQDNIVSITAAANTFASANQDSFIQGVEFNGEYLFDGGWSTYGNFWYTYGRNDVTNAPLSRIPPAQGILGLRWRTSDARSWWSMYAWMVRNQDRLDTVRDVTDERIPAGGTPGYTTLNMRAGHAFGDAQQHRVSLSLENLTDKSYLVHGSGVYGTGFTARFGYSLVY